MRSSSVRLGGVSAFFSGCDVGAGLVESGSGLLDDIVGFSISREHLNKCDGECVTAVYRWEVQDILCGHHRDKPGL